MPLRKSPPSVARDEPRQCPELQGTAYPGGKTRVAAWFAQTREVCPTRLEEFRVG